MLLAFHSSVGVAATCRQQDTACDTPAGSATSANYGKPCMAEGGHLTEPTWAAVQQWMPRVQHCNPTFGIFSAVERWREKDPSRESRCRARTDLVATVHKLLLLHTVTTDTDFPVPRSSPPGKLRTINQVLDTFISLHNVLRAVPPHTATKGSKNCLIRPDR